MADDEEERRTQQEHAKGAQDEGHATGDGFFLRIAGEDLVPLAGLQDALFLPELGFFREPSAEAFGEEHGGMMRGRVGGGEGEGGLGRLVAVGG